MAGAETPDAIIAKASQGSGVPLVKVATQKARVSMDSDIQELVDEVTGPAEHREGACDVCGADLNPVHDTQAEGICHRCFFSRLTVAQRCDLVAEHVMPYAHKWGEAEVLAKMKEALDTALLLAESRDARLVGQWADGFVAGLVASRKLPANRGLSVESFGKLVDEWSAQPQPTGD